MFPTSRGLGQCQRRAGGPHIPRAGGPSNPSTPTKQPRGCPTQGRPWNQRASVLNRVRPTRAKPASVLHCRHWRGCRVVISFTCANRPKVRCHPRRLRVTTVLNPDRNSSAVVGSGITIAPPIVTTATSALLTLNTADWARPGNMKPNGSQSDVAGHNATSASSVPWPPMPSYRRTSPVPPFLK